VKLSWMFLALLLAASPAIGQMYKWVDKDGKVRYGDTPPPGSKSTSMKAQRHDDAQPAAPASRPPQANPKDAPKLPLTAAEKEQDYRKRREEAEKSANKAQQESQAKAAMNEGCERSKEYLRTLQSGQRIARTNAAGERYFMDENQVAQEVAKAQQSIQQACK